MQLIDLAEKLLSIDSSPEVGNTFACEYLVALCQDLGLKTKVEKCQMDGVEQNILYVFKKEKDSFENIFWSNLQTSNPGIYSFWDETDCNPYKLTIKDNKIYGLGTSSGKLNFLLQILTLAKLPKDKGENLALVGGFGSLQEKEGAKFFLQNNKAPKAVIASEPSDLKFCRDYSGSVVLRMFLPFNKKELDFRAQLLEKEATSTQTKIFKAKPSFAFQVNKGNHLLVNVLDFLKTLPSETMILNIEIGDSPFLSPSDGLIELDVNSHSGMDFTERLVLSLEAIDKIFRERFTRYVKKYDLADFPEYNIGFMRTLETGLEMEGSFFLTHGVDKKRVKSWAALLGETNLDVSVQNFSQAQRLPAGHELEAKVEAMGGTEVQNKLQHIQGDTAFFLAKGIPSLGFGPGNLSGYNIINEYNFLSQIETAENIYKNIMEDF